MPAIRGAEPVVGVPDAEAYDFDVTYVGCSACLVAQQVKSVQFKLSEWECRPVKTPVIGINDEEVVNIDCEEMISRRVFTASNLLLCRAGVWSV